MSSELLQMLESVNGHRENRLKTAQYIIANPKYFKDLIALCFMNDKTDSYKACWVLEFVAYEKLEWFADYLDYFCENLKFVTNESAIRPLAKIIQILLKSHYKKTESSIIFSEDQIQNCIEASFDWLISDTKVATKAYSMRTLYLLGNHYNWIHPDLKQIISNQYHNHTSAYKAVAREILKKIK